MANDSRRLRLTHLRDPRVAFSHNVPDAPCASLYQAGYEIMAGTFDQAHGKRVPIFRGSPPTLDE